MRRLPGVVLAGLTAAALLAKTTPDIHRTIYFTATTARGVYVAKLTSADIAGVIQVMTAITSV